MRHLLLLFLVAGCTRPEAIRISTPPLDGAASVVVVIDQGGPDIRAFGLATDDEKTAVEVAYEQSDASVTALLYDESLMEIGLESGELPLTSDAVTGRTLEPPRIIWTSSFDGKTQTAWDVANELPARVAELRVDVEQDLDPCAFIPDYEVINHITDSRYNGRGAVPLDDGRVFYGMEDGRFFYLTPETLVEADDVPAGLPGGAMFKAVDGELWLVGEAGRAARGRPGGGFSSIPDAPHVDEVRWLAGPTRSDVPFELFALSSFDGAMSRYDGTAWTQIRPGPRMEAGGIVWLGEQNVIFARSSDFDLTTWDHGQLDTENPNAGTVGMFTIGDVPSVGLVVGVASGAIHAQIEGVWTFIGAFEFASVQSVAPFGDDGFVVGGTDGFLAFYRPGRFCIQQVAASDVLHIVPVGDDFVLVLSNVHKGMPLPQYPPTVVTWLRAP